jgi:hypothetical protein
MLTGIVTEDKTTNEIQMRLQVIFVGLHHMFTTMLDGFATREQMVSPSISGKAFKGSEKLQIGDQVK